MENSKQLLRVVVMVVRCITGRGVAEVRHQERMVAIMDKDTAERGGDDV